MLEQVVAGMKYIFTVEMARTNCRKGGVETECEIHSDLTLAKVEIMLKHSGRLNISVYRFLADA